jgi:branched-chain amino acid transport system permease protein
MALGLSVIFGVARVVNFAHGEIMTVAMYTAVSLFAALGLNPFVTVAPIAVLFFIFGYLLQTKVINAFIAHNSCP